MKVILLDLNYTLVANSEVKIRPFENQIKQEVYRIDLIERIKKDRVILVTARPDKHRVQTLQHIRKETGWQPEEAYFNSIFYPWVFKEKILITAILPRYTENEIIAIESNPRTRTMYENHNIQVFTYDQILNGVK
jgi:hypothetical protein